MRWSGVPIVFDQQSYATKVPQNSDDDDILPANDLGSDLILFWAITNDIFTSVILLSASQNWKYSIRVIKEEHMENSKRHATLV
jgi:hypothetical protein